MDRIFKPHLLKIERKRTSLGRDLSCGLRLDRNERVSDFPVKIMAGILDSIRPHLLTAYPDTENFYAALSDWLKIPSECLYITNAITEAIRIIFETLIDPQDEVVTISPTFPMYKIYSQIYQAKLKEVGFLKNLTLDKNGLFKSINKETTLVCLPNPNLPIESALSIEELRGLAGKCRKLGVMLVVDEAYAFFGASSAIPLIQEFDNVIVLQTFSKAFGLAGLRLGYIISNKKNIEYLTKTRSLVESNAISMAIGEYMLKRPRVMRDYVSQVKEGKEFVQNSLTMMGYRWFGGNLTNGMLIFLKDKGEVDNTLAYLKNKKIYVRGSFEYPIENCMRLTLGPKPQMKQFINALAGYRKRSC